MKAILTCVDYGDILSLTLPYNRHHFDSVMIITSPHDEETIELAKANNCQLHITADFYIDNADFNKWIPLEQGLDKLGRDGPLCIMDADIVWPKMIKPIVVQPNILYSPKRYINEQLTLPPENEWPALPIHKALKYFAGYTQIFDGRSSCLKVPWHPSHHHCGGPDTVFQSNFDIKRRLPFIVLHIGPTETNWCGRNTIRADGTKVLGSDLRKSKIEKTIKEHTRTFRKYL